MSGINYYALEEIIVSRMIDTCPKIHFVRGLPDIFAIYDNQQFANELNADGKGGAAFVIFWGEEVVEARKECDRATHTYIVAIVTKRHDKLRTGERARLDNGGLVNQVLQGLRNWDYAPSLDYTAGKMRLKRVTCPVNRHQFPPDQNGLVVTFLAYQAENLIT